MIALVLLVIVSLWALFGYFVWRALLGRWIKSEKLYWGTAFLLGAIWLVGPWLDEWLGASEFKKLCDEMPAVAFYGPVAVGAGPFYNEDGTPKWRTAEQFHEISHPLWSSLFSDDESVESIRDFPVPVLERRIVRRFRPTGQPVEVFVERLSPGGWVKRATGWSSQASYQCPWKGYVAREDRDYITFSK